MKQRGHIRALLFEWQGGEVCIGAHFLHDFPQIGELQQIDRHAEEGFSAAIIIV